MENVSRETIENNQHNEESMMSDQYKEEIADEVSRMGGYIDQDSPSFDSRVRDYQWQSLSVEEAARNERDHRKQQREREELS